MKKQFLIATFLLMATTSNVFAIPHNLKEHGMVEGVTQVYTSAENKENLSPIVKTYYERIQQGKYDIPIKDLQKLHEELCKILAQKSHHQI